MGTPLTLGDGVFDLRHTQTPTISRVRVGSIQAMRPPPHHHHPKSGYAHRISLTAYNTCCLEKKGYISQRAPSEYQITSNLYIDLYMRGIVRSRLTIL